MRRAFTILFALSVVFAAPAAPAQLIDAALTPASACLFNPPTVDQGVLSGHPLGFTQNGGVVVITSPSAWTAFWAQHKAIVFPAPPPPAVDFTSNFVVAAFAGLRWTSGFGMNVDIVCSSALALTVFDTETVPGPNCTTFPTLTQPYHLVQVPRAFLSLGGVVENRKVVVVDCP